MSELMCKGKCVIAPLVISHVFSSVVILEVVKIFTPTEPAFFLCF